MERDAHPYSKACEGYVPMPPEDNEIISCPTEDLAGNPIGYLIDWPNVSRSCWIESLDQDSFVALDECR